MNIEKALERVEKLGHCELVVVEDIWAIKTLAAEVRRLQKDKERLDWLFSATNSLGIGTYEDSNMTITIYSGEKNTETDVRQAIDAAMTNEKEKE